MDLLWVWPDKWNILIWKIFSCDPTPSGKHTCTYWDRPNLQVEKDLSNLWVTQSLFLLQGQWLSWTGGHLMNLIVLIMFMKVVSLAQDVHFRMVMPLTLCKYDNLLHCISSFYHLAFITYYLSLGHLWALASFFHRFSSNEPFGSLYGIWTVTHLM